MKLTRSTSLTDFAGALEEAALQSSLKACGVRSHAGACGSLEHLIFSLVQLNPKGLALVNDYIARHAVMPAAEVPSPAGAATTDEAECARLRAKIEDHQMRHRELREQALALRRNQHATILTAADADAMAAAAALEAPNPLPEHTAECGAPTAGAQSAPSALPGPNADPLTASSQSAPSTAPEQTGGSALTETAPEPALPVPPSQASSARSNTPECGGSHSSPNPTEEG